MSLRSWPWPPGSPLPRCSRWWRGPYLLEIRRAWATPVNATTNQYASDVYLSRILAAIVGTTGVINARGAVLNGAAEDLALQENGTAQEVPVLGTVTLHV